MSRRFFFLISFVFVGFLFMGAWCAFAQSPVTTNPQESYSWRYQKITEHGREGVKRVRMTWEEAQAWDKQEIEKYKQDAVQGKINGQPPQSDPTAVATWKHYYEQLKLWQDYVQNVCFNGETLSATIEEMTWARGQSSGGPGAAGASGGFRPGGVEGIVAANQNKSLDQQTGEFFTVGGGSGGQGQQGAPPITKDDIEKQVMSLYKVLKEQGKQIDEKAYRADQEISTGLVDREGRRLAFKNWLNEQKDLVIETALEWGKRQEGQVVVVDGVHYELYSPAQGAPQGEGPSDVVRVVTDNFSPYDILNPDGSLRQPIGH